MVVATGSMLSKNFAVYRFPSFVSGFCWSLLGIDSFDFFNKTHVSGIAFSLVRVSAV